MSPIPVSHGHVPTWWTPTVDMGGKNLSCSLTHDKIRYNRRMMTSPGGKNLSCSHSRSPQNIPPKKFHQKHQENDEFAQFSLSSCIIKSMRFNQMFKVSFISTAKNDVESKKANASYFFTSKSSSLGHHLSSASSLASSSFTSAPSSLPSYSSSSPCGFELLSCTHSDLSRFYGSTC